MFLIIFGMKDIDNYWLFNFEWSFDVFLVILYIYIYYCGVLEVYVY